MPKKTKLDLHEKFKSEYVTPRQPAFVMVGPAKYLAITGQGAPGGDRFRAHISALYAIAFTLKMTEKFAGHDYKVCHLEGQWWADDGSDFHTHQPKEWQWRLLIRVPEFITQAHVDAAIKTVIEKGKSAAANNVKLEELTEGRCVQMLHTGPYGEERSRSRRCRNWLKAAVSICVVRTTRSISPIPIASRRNVCGRSCAIRWNKETVVGR